ncbi:tRNA (adenosine(37)-N6)-threonylcarbamoyltransferase complex ATPase subunit type 1 TsaE [Candidatus Saccharibacteria bacterium]|nr:tRNA (adenosine(37)-N6)-threonylcarbamoyltransferase complex ATPase subunit type 1 TsaE [Candidatus Saccharibacteria bacterium]
MKITSEQEMLDYGKSFAGKLSIPCVIELLGDVGTGKTTFTRGLAEGLGVKEPVTSPSFTISKTYAFKGGELIHYDFYRLGDPGLMADDLNENINNNHAVIVVEWAESVENFLPENRKRIEIKLNDDGTREVTEL